MISVEALSCINVPHTYFTKKIDQDFSVSTDSRSIQKNSLFIALVGEKFDGFDYAEDVISKGAIAIVYQKKDGRSSTKLQKKYPEICIIETDDTLKFLQELSRSHKNIWNKNKDKIIVGLTGSNGKTTHKEMLKFILSEVFPEKVLATKGNLNNHIGVPLTLFELEKEHDIAIVEMGMNHRHEIANLCEIAGPEHGLITNIGQAHIGYLGSMENIFFEKSDLYRAVLKNKYGLGQFVVNVDDNYLQYLQPSTGLTTFSLSQRGNIQVKINEQSIKFNFRGNDFSITNENIQESYNLNNLVCVTLLALKLFPEKRVEIVRAASRYQQPSMNRSEWIDNIFLDAYNANPSSMKASLESFLKIAADKNISLNECLFILGDMNELGEYTEKFHTEIAESLVDKKMSNVFFIGRYKEYYLKGMPNPLGSYENVEKFLEYNSEYKKPFKLIFIKGSRSVKMENLIK